MKLGIKRITLNKNTWWFIIVAITIIVTDDTLWFGSNGEYMFFIYKYVVLGTIGLYLGIKIIQNYYKDIHTWAFIILLTMFFIVLLSMIFNHDFELQYIYKITIFIISYGVCLFLPIEKFAEYFTKIMYFLSVFSSIGVLLVAFNRSILAYFPTWVNIRGIKFYNMGLVMIQDQFFELALGKIPRNFGIFREPGVFQMYIVFAFIFHIYYAKRIKISYIVAYVLGIILTFSTTGYIALFFTILLYLIKENKLDFSNKNFIVLVIFFFTGGIYLVTQTDLLSSEGIVFNKFYNIKRHTIIARFASITSNFEIWKTSPLIGVGINNLNSLFFQYTGRRYGYASRDNSNTLMSELATYGVLYAIIMCIGYYLFSSRLTSRKIEKILLLLIFFVLSCGERIVASPILFIMLFYGFRANKKKEFGKDN